MKATLSKLRNTTARFSKDDNGAIAIVIGLAAVPFFVAAGIALDTYRAGSARAEVQASLDAAALAAASASPSATEAERRSAAEKAFDANIKGKLGDQLSGSQNVTFENGTVTVAYNGTIPTTIMQIGGFNTMNVNASSTATMRRSPRAEIALVLDYSGSMTETSGGQVKYVTMKNAAIDMVNGLSDNGQNSELEFALVPFSHHVYATLPGHMVRNAGGGSWTGCTQDRRYPYNTQVAAPSGGNNTKWNQPMPSSYAAYGGQANYHCDGYNHNGNGYAARNLVVRELTSDHGAITSQLNAMEPYAYTHISLGFQFGWQVLDPGAPFAARSYNDPDNKKFMVLLTDGRQTTPSFGSGNSRNIQKGEQNLTTLCGNVKNSNITVITIAFDLQDNATRNRLRNCSTDPDKHFFVAEDGDDLTSAFEEIQNQIASAIYLSK